MVAQKKGYSFFILYRRIYWKGLFEMLIILLICSRATTLESLNTSPPVFIYFESHRQKYVKDVFTSNG